MIDFTLAAYSELLEAILTSGYQVLTVASYFSGKEKGGVRSGPILILRHDAEWNPHRALDVAKIEAVKGIRATYYFRADTRVYDITIMRDIQDMGHEVGYHFNVLDRCQGDFAKAIMLFEEDLERFRRDGFLVSTVCSHGDPRAPKKGYKVNNEILVYDPELKERTGILGEAYLDVNFAPLKYVSDVGIRWNIAASTPELIKWFQSKREPLVYMLTHPDYWSAFPGRAVAMRSLAKAMRATKVNSLVVSWKKSFRKLFGQQKSR